MYDIIIIGAGPAGLNAGLYASRAGLDVLIIEGTFSGGQAATTFEVDNYIGFDTSIGGVELSMKMDSHAKKFGAKVKNESVVSLDLNRHIKKVKTTKNEYGAKSVILCMGASPRTLGLEKEHKYRGRGVSYCATCDGGFYKDKRAMVIGGGDTALEDAIYLSNICEKVFLVHRRDEFRGSAYLQKRVSENTKIEIVLNSEAVEFLGDDFLNGVDIKNKLTNKITKYAVDAVFIAVGTIPNTDLIMGILETDKMGYIITDEDMKTSIKGVFAAGDIRKKSLRQIITAASDGAVAANSALWYLGEEI